MDFEYDPNKSELNRAKHGIDFENAKRLWADTRLVRVPARSEGEYRIMFVGRIDDHIWSAVCVYRGEVIRIISVRRSRPGEIENYESN